MTLKRLDTPYGRVYVRESDDGPKFYPSVTTILSKLPSEYLNNLEKEIGAEKLKEISEAAAGRGTVMHRFAENYLICIKNGKEKDKCMLYTQKKTSQEMASQFDQKRIEKGRDLFYNLYYEHFDIIHQVIETEKFLFSDAHGYAGTTDLVYESVLGSTVVGDFKSANQICGDEKLKKYLYQVAAYMLAYEERTGNAVDIGEVIVSHPMGVQTVTLSREESAVYKKAFIELANKYHEEWNIEPILQYYRSVAS